VDRAGRGFGGLRHTDAGLFFAPRLPDGWKRMSFGLSIGDGNLRVEVLPDTVTYSYTGKEPLEVHHGDMVLSLEPDKPVTQPVQAPAEREAPSQPKPAALRCTAPTTRYGWGDRARVDLESFSSGLIASGSLVSLRVSRAVTGVGIEVRSEGTEHRVTAASGTDVGARVPGWSGVDESHGITRNAEPDDAWRDPVPA
jgi:hypothetical protein